MGCSSPNSPKVLFLASSYSCSNATSSKQSSLIAQLKKDCMTFRLLTHLRCLPFPYGTSVHRMPHHTECRLTCLLSEESLVRTGQHSTPCWHTVAVSSYLWTKLTPFER